ncbi:hypothetical protein ACWCRF_38840 [Streptomyces sp. NPDC002405]
MREHICLIARTSPADLGPDRLCTWTLPRLADHLVQRHVIPKTSRETLRRTLCSDKVSWQATTWRNASTDPDYIGKTHRFLVLYDTPPADHRDVQVRGFRHPVGDPRHLDAAHRGDKHAPMPTPSAGAQRPGHVPAAFLGAGPGIEMALHHLPQQPPPRSGDTANQHFLGAGPHHRPVQMSEHLLHSGTAGGEAFGSGTRCGGCAPGRPARRPGAL